MVCQDTVARDVLGYTMTETVSMFASGGVSRHSSKICVGGYTMTENVYVFVVRWCIKTQ